MWWYTIWTIFYDIIKIIRLCYFWKYTECCHFNQNSGQRHFDLWITFRASHLFFMSLVITRFWFTTSFIVDVVSYKVSHKQSNCLTHYIKKIRSLSLLISKIQMNKKKPYPLTCLVWSEAAKRVRVFVYPEVFTLLFLKLAQLTYANGGILTLLMYCKQTSSPLTHRSTVINKTLVHCHRLVLQKHSHMQMCLVYQQHEHYKAHTDTHTINMCHMHYTWEG